MRGKKREKYLSLFHQHFSRVFERLDRQANRAVIPVSIASPINR